MVFMDTFYTIKLKKTTNERYSWQKIHQENLTGTDKAFYPNKNKDAIKKKYKTWKS